MRWAPIALLLLLVGCGHSPTSPDPVPTPTPTPQPPPASFTGTVTNTITGGPVLGFTATIEAGRVTVSAPGYVTHSHVQNGPTIDLIPESSFDVEFYRQFARGSLDGPMQPLRVLTAAPSIYLQTAGLTGANVAALEQAARNVVPAMTGGRFQVQAWETGTEARPERAGWIVVELVTDPAATCGLSLIGASAGHVWLSTAPRCSDGHQTIDPGVFIHEVGHSLGFAHVSQPGSIMFPNVRRAPVVPDNDRRYAAIAYARPRGNTDLDQDP